MKQSIRDLQAVFDSYHNILQHALNGKLAINTLSVRAIHDALLDLKRIGNKKNLKLAYPEVSQIFRAKVSLLRTNSGSRIFLTIPMIGKKSRYDLYSFQSIPFFATNNTMIKITPEKNLLAVRYENNNLMFKFEDLEKCMQLENSFICKESIVYKGNYKSCLKQIFVSISYEKILNSCNRYIIPAETQIVPLSSNEFLMIFPKESAYDLICKNFTEHRKITGISKVKVENNCELIFQDFIVKPIESNKIEKNLVWKYWTGDSNLFLGNLSDDRLDAILKKAKNLRDIPKISPILTQLLDKIDNRPWFQFNTHPQLNFTTLIILFIIFAVFLTILIILCRKMKKERSYRKELKFEKLEQRYPMLRRQNQE